MAADDGLKRAGAAVVARRDERGLSQLALAQEASVDPKTLRSLENGVRWPRGKSRSAIEHALQWPTGALESIRNGIDPFLAEKDVHLAGVMALLHHVATEPNDLRALRKALVDQSIEALPRRVDALTRASKMKVHQLVTQLEDDEHEAAHAALTGNHGEPLGHDPATLDGQGDVGADR